MSQALKLLFGSITARDLETVHGANCKFRSRKLHSVHVNNNARNSRRSIQRLTPERGDCRAPRSGLQFWTSSAT